MLFKRLRNIIRSRWISGDTNQSTWENASETFDDFQQQANDYGQYTQTEASGFSTQEAKYYAALELTPGANFPDIKKAYKRLVKQYHPDKFPQDEQKRKYAENVTQQLNEAYRFFEDKFGQK